MDFLQNRRETANSRLHQLKNELTKARKLAEGKACVYLIGSYGRGEASLHSDLDLFIVGGGIKEERDLKNLEEILIKADLIEATRKLDFPEFSGDGEYLKHYTVDDLVETLGTRDDDKANTFTARLLLLLESLPLLEDTIYSNVISKVIEAYWEDYEDHGSEFVPAFLVNDILRLWRTFCVNYEAGTKNENETLEQKAKRKLKNYKLKHSRLLTCYSGLLYLMAVIAEQGTVRPDNVKHMVSLSPTKRLEWLKGQAKFVNQSNRVDTILSLYEKFLKKTDAPKKNLIEMFQDRIESGQALQEAREFGDQVYDLLCFIGKDNKVFRFLVV
ncbi:nucleotidyltransferase family protein [Nitrospira sp. T9]|uniref:nucleotidyltransferase family protein n=1 Tax=unclassified Nitrospira TaxID=2652172 RepID=UPI003F980E28